MRRAMAAALAAVMLLAGCEKKETVDYAQAILGTWYAVEYESESVEFRDDGIVADTFSSETTYGNYVVDSENLLILVNFGDDVFSLQIQDEDGKLTLIDNNGTLVREEDRDAAREEYRAQKGK